MRTAARAVVRRGRARHLGCARRLIRVRRGWMSLAVTAELYLPDRRRRPRFWLWGAVIAGPVLLTPASAAEAQAGDQFLVVFVVVLLDVAEEALALTYHLEETAAAVVVLLVVLQVLAQFLDASGEDGHLDGGGAGVLLVLAVLLDQFLLHCWGYGHVHYLSDSRPARIRNKDDAEPEVNWRSVAHYVRFGCLSNQSSRASRRTSRLSGRPERESS